MTKPMELLVKNEGKGFGLILDGKLLHHVLGYKIESLQKGDYAKLSIKMIVRYPVIQEKIP